MDAKSKKIKANRHLTFKKNLTILKNKDKNDDEDSNCNTNVTESREGGNRHK